MWDEAQALAVKAHKHQFRDDGSPYWWHPQRVAQATAIALGTQDHPACAVAWLHDTIEDCGLTQGDIGAQFGPEVARDVDSLSIPKGAGDKTTWLVSAVPEWSENAILVKQLDRADNLLSAVGAWDKHRIHGYWKQTLSLVAAIANDGRVPLHPSLLAAGHGVRGLYGFDQVDIWGERLWWHD